MKNSRSTLAGIFFLAGILELEKVNKQLILNQTDNYALVVFEELKKKVNIQLIIYLGFHQVIM